MTKDKALFEYFNGFMTAYPSTSVPDDIIFPYLTYEYKDAAFNDNRTNITVNMYFYTDSEVVPNAKARDLKDYITENNKVECDEGKLWINPGSPWSQAVPYEANTGIKMRTINVEIEHWTN